MLCSQVSTPRAVVGVIDHQGRKLQGDGEIDNKQGSVQLSSCFDWMLDAFALVRMSKLWLLTLLHRWFAMKGLPCATASGRTRVGLFLHLLQL